MTKIEELETQLTAIQEELNKLKVVESDATWPNNAVGYYVINFNGKVAYFVREFEENDKRIQSIGNIFRTEEDAEKEIEARKVIAELRRQPGVKKFEVDERNYSATARLGNSTIAIDCWETDANGFGQVYFETYKDADNAIKTVGEDRILAAAKWLAVGV